MSGPRVCRPSPGLARSFDWIQGLRASRLPLATFSPRLRRSMPVTHSAAPSALDARDAFCRAFGARPEAEPGRNQLFFHGYGRAYLCLTSGREAVAEVVQKLRSQRRDFPDKKPKEVYVNRSRKCPIVTLSFNSRN